MVMPTTEHRERLVAGGCDENLADAIMVVAVAVRDDAVEEAVARAMEEVAHSAGLLNGRIDRHDEKNEAQFQVIESTIREIAAQIRIEIADLRTENERRFTDLQTEMGQRLTNLETENERRFSGVQTQIAGVEGQIAELRGEMAGLRGEMAGLEGQIAELRGEMAGLEGQIAELRGEMAGLEGQIAELRGEIAALRAQGEANYERLQTTIHRAALGVVGLVIAVTGVVVGILAATGAFG